MAQKILSKKKNWYGADNVTYENQFAVSNWSKGYEKC